MCCYCNDHLFHLVVHALSISSCSISTGQRRSPPLHFDIIAFLSSSPLCALDQVSTPCMRFLWISTGSITPRNVNNTLIVDSAYDRFMIWGLRSLLRIQTGLSSPVLGYAGLVSECKLPLATAGAEEQRIIVERLLYSSFMPRIGVFLFRTLLKGNPKLKADFAPLIFTWLVGEAERNNLPEGGEGVDQLRWKRGNVTRLVRISHTSCL